MRRIRTSKPHDIEDLLEIEKDCFKDPNPALLVRVCGKTDSLLVSENSAELEGYVLVAPSDAETSRVVSLGVRSEYRRQGIATSLLRRSVERAWEKGTEKIELEVRVSNSAAMNLYDKMGFSRVGRKPGYYDDGEDAYLMEKKLG
ncbi:MAG: ribosomal protein S18-alanine N-acetyltransferase [Halobacteria archaeon]|nr:ribosomal protein S18-alanine N-acetyltransferase [Halobacteria archaeon]